VQGETFLFERIPKSKPYELLGEAERLWLLAEYDRAIAILIRLEPNERVIALLAKILSRQRKTVEAVALVETYCKAHGDRPLLCAIAACAAAQFEPANVVDDWIARVGWLRLCPARVRGEAAFYVAQAYWISARYDEAEIIIPMTCADGSPNGTLRSRILVGLQHGVKGRYAAQARVLAFAMTRARGQFVETFLLANALHTLAGLAAELPNVIDTVALQQHFDQVAWPEQKIMSRFQAMRCLASRYAMDGKFEQAYRLLWQAVKSAPTSACKLHVSLDLVRFAQWCGDARYAHANLCRAIEFAGVHDLSNLTADEMPVLLNFAEALAESNSEQALRWITRYEDMKLDDRLGSLLRDHRLEAAANFARGVVHHHAGNRVPAEDALRKAFEVFSAIGYDWRAARAAFILHEITRAKKWASACKKYLGDYPPNTIGKAGALAIAAFYDPEYGSLTPAERELFQMLLVDNLSLRDIAAKSHRAIGTCKLHLKAVMKKLGAHSQEELRRIAKAKNLI